MFKELTIFVKEFIQSIKSNKRLKAKTKLFNSGNDNPNIPKSSTRPRFLGK